MSLYINSLSMAYLFIILLAVGYFGLRSRIVDLETKFNSYRPQNIPVPPPPQHNQQPQQIVEQTPEIVSVPIPPPPSPAQVVVKADDNLEFKFGSKIITGIGAVAVIFGLGFFLRYAFQTGLISESMRVMFGGFIGAIFVGIGLFVNKKYSTYGQTLAGTGVGILYLSIYSSYSFYNLISYPAALVLMIIVTIIGVSAALMLDAIALAGFAGLGGFLTPFLLSGSIANPHLLFSYIIALDIGLLAIAFYKLWRPLVFGSFIATALVYISWFADSYSRNQWFVAEAYLTLFFIIFLLVSLTHYLRNQTVEDEADLTLLISNASVYYLLSYIIIDRQFSGMMGLFTASLGCLYLILWLIVRANDPRDIRFRSFVAGIGFVFFIIAVPVQFDTFAITIIWALQALLLAFLGRKINSHALKISSVSLFTITVVKLLGIDSFISVTDPFINTRFITYLISFICAVTTVYLLSTPQASAEDRPLISYFLSGAYIVIISMISFEIGDFFDSYWYVIAWSLIACVAFYCALFLRSKILRVLVYCTYVITIIRVLVDQSSVDLRNYIPLMNSRVVAFLVVALSLFITVYLLKISSSEDVDNDEKKNMTAIGAVVANVLLVYLLSLEVTGYFDQKIIRSGSTSTIITLENTKRVALSVAWLGYSAIILIIGIARRLVSARIFALTLIGITIFKVFLYDTAELDNFYRFVSYFGLGILLLIVGFLYNKFKETIIHFIKQ